MAQFSIKTSKDEQDKIFKVIKKYDGQQVSMSTLGEEAGINANRVRWIVADLVADGKVEKSIIKDASSYKRYCYHIL